MNTLTQMPTLTQQEIDTLPAPPQEWLDALYPKYDMLPTEIWNKIYDIKYDLEVKEHNMNKCKFLELDDKVNMPTKKVREEFTPITAKEYQAKSTRKLRPVNGYKLTMMLHNGCNKKELTKVCKKLQTQKRPRKETYIEFDRIMNVIKQEAILGWNSLDKLFELNKIYLEDSTAEDIYNKEDNAYWEKHHQLQQLCWDENDKERKIDRLVSC